MHNYLKSKAFVLLVDFTFINIRVKYLLYEKLKFKHLNSMSEQKSLNHSICIDLHRQYSIQDD